MFLGAGHVEGDDLICGVHGWDYRVDTGISEYDNSGVLEKFPAWVDEDAVYVDAGEVAAWAADNPQPYDDPEPGDGGDGAMQGATDAVHPEFYGEPDHEKEPYSHYIQTLAQQGPEGIGEHGDVSAMASTTT